MFKKGIDRNPACFGNKTLLLAIFWPELAQLWHAQRQYLLGLHKSLGIWVVPEVEVVRSFLLEVFNCMLGRHF